MGLWKPLSGQIVHSFGHRKCTFDCLGISKTMALATISKQAHAF